MEMLLATGNILIGLVAVAQLVPASVMMNSNSRNDSSALVFGQRVLEAIREQPLWAKTYGDPQGIVCPAGTTCNLGDPTKPGQIVGSPVIPVNGAPLIDFSEAPVDGYSFTYVDPNDPVASTYDVRWAVVTQMNGSVVTGRRIILGVFRRGMRSPTMPVTLDTMVQK